MRAHPKTALGAAIGLLVVVVALSAATAPATTGVFSLDRLRLGGATGAEDYLYTAGNVVYPDGGTDPGTFYRFVVTDPSGVVHNPSFPCSPAASFPSADNTYTVQPGDPLSPGTPWKVTLKQYTSSTCTGGAAKSASKSFYVAAATAYADPALTTPKTSFPAGATAYVFATGVTPSLTSWSMTWITPSGAVACSNTSGADRPDASSTSNLPPKWTNSSLQYPPNANATGSQWNRQANYDPGSACPAPGSANEGRWTLQVQADATDFVTLPVFTVDATPPPAPSIDSAPTNPSNSSSASFAFSDGESGVSYRCQLDGGTLAACTSPAAYGGLADGSHTFRVNAVDAAGNVGAVTSRTWTVDTAPPPSPTITSAPSDPSHVATASFGFADADTTATFRCQLDAAGFAVCSSPFSYRGLADGSHTFQVKAVDPAGNESTLTTRTWTVDAPPVISLTSPAPGAVTNDPTPTFAGTAETGPDDAAAATVKVYAGPSAAGTPVESLVAVWGSGGAYSVDAAPPLADGIYTAQAGQTDNGGNTGKSAAVTFTVDTTPPLSAISSAPTDPSGSSTPTFAFTANESATFACSVDGAGFSSCASPTSVPNLAEGEHTFAVRATDVAGNVETTPATYTWDVDLTAPTVTLVSPADGSTVDDALPSFGGTAGTADGDLGTVTVAVYAGADVSGTVVQTLTADANLDGSYAVAPATPLADGTYTAQAQQADRAGNVGRSSTHTFTVATTAPPLNTSSPTIDGIAQKDETLSADPGVWSGTQPVGYAFQWRRCASDGGSCSNVDGATSSTYDVGAADVGSTLRVRVTASNAEGSSTADSAATAAVTASPSNTAPPTISGPTSAGSTLTADPGTWSGTQPIAFAYQWRRCDATGAGCADLAGATDSSYAVVNADVGSTLRVAVTASNVSGSSTTASAATATVTSPPINKAPPTISGTVKEGQTLSGDRGTWSGATGFSYQWRRCEDDGDCAAIPGATGTTYVLTSDDDGGRIAFSVTATNDVGATTVTSAATPVVQALTPYNQEPPTIVGAAQNGQTLQAAPGVWTGTLPIAFTYQWQRCDSLGAHCAAIAGATAQAYTLAIADVTSTIRVGVMGTNGAGSDSATSDPTAQVTGIYRSVVLADAPVGYWRLGEASGTTASDETANADSGAYQGGITLGMPGALAGDANTAPLFGGVNGQVNFGNPANGVFKFGTSSFSVEAWVKPAVKGTQISDDMPIVAKQSPITANPSWELTFTDDPGFVGRVRAKINDTTGATIKAYSSVRIDDGKWHHVVAVFDRVNGVTVYVDGVAGTTAAGATPGSVDNNTALLIGQEGRSYPYFNGQIDEVALYRGLLSADRIRSHYQNGAAAQVTPPAATAPPTVSGTATNSYLLTTNGGTWSGTQPISVSYQWQRCDSSGASCAPIPGQTTPSYPLAPADVGSTIRVKATAANAGGVATSTSAASPLVANGPSDPVVAAAGDIACRTNATSNGTTCHYGLTSNLILNDLRLTDVLALGDDQYDCGDYPFFVNLWGPTWGAIKAKFHPVPGNHEYLTYAPQNPDGSQPSGTLDSCDPSTTVPGAGYFDYWNGVGAAGGPAGDRDKGYYSYDIGYWHLIALNTECYAIRGCDVGSPEETWLRSDLATHATACTLAYWHEPLFSSGHVGDNQYVKPLWNDLYAAGVEIVLNGHDHDYERFAPQTPAGALDTARGIREFVVGTGGRSHGSIDALQPNSQVQNDDTYGVLKLTLHPSSYDWQFVPENGKTFTDAGSTNCH